MCRLIVFIRVSTGAAAVEWCNLRINNGVAVDRATVVLCVTITSKTYPNGAAYTYESMALKLLLFGGLVLLALAQEDSLQSALNAIQQRQKDLEKPQHDEAALTDITYYPPHHLAFLSEPDGERDKASVRGILDSLDAADGNYQASVGDVLGKYRSSPFRERLAQAAEDGAGGKQRHVDVADNKVDANPNLTNDDYGDLVRGLLATYEDVPTDDGIVAVADAAKRPYYPDLGLGGAGLRKRKKLEDFNDIYSNDGGDAAADDNSVYHWHPPNGRGGGARRFPLAKRSSGPAGPPDGGAAAAAASSPAKTDPKVEKELASMFGGAKAPDTVRNSTKSDLMNTNLEIEEATLSDDVPISITRKPRKRFLSKRSRPASVAKKSVKWSDYFGLDRRKKIDLDHGWLIERYHRSMALPKRSANYPLPQFTDPNQGGRAGGSGQLARDDSKLVERADSKLDAMEETILDDTIKLTGANAGAADAAEVQDAKDKIIARLAAAYNLEKMRKALQEYRGTVKERVRLTQQPAGDGGADGDMKMEKRVSVPRKQAVDPERAGGQEADNNIKCAHTGSECSDNGYRTPTEVQLYEAIDACPDAQQICHNLFGHFIHDLKPACEMHLMCLVCSGNSWYTPIHHCNVVYLSKARESCGGRKECNMEAEHALRYVLDASITLKLENMSPMCERACYYRL